MGAINAVQWFHSGSFWKGVVVFFLPFVFCDLWSLLAGVTFFFLFFFSFLLYFQSYLLFCVGGSNCFLYDIKNDDVDAYNIEMT